MTSVYWRGSLSTYNCTLVLLVITILLARLMVSPASPLALFSDSIIYCNSFPFSDTSTRSSAKRRWLKYLVFTFMPHPFQTSLFIIDSSVAISSIVDSGSPCLTPLFTGNQEPAVSSLTLLLLFLYILLITLIYSISTFCVVKTVTPDKTVTPNRMLFCNRYMPSTRVCFCLGIFR